MVARIRHPQEISHSRQPLRLVEFRQHSGSVPMARLAPTRERPDSSPHSWLHQSNPVVAGIADVQPSLSVVVAEECRLIERRFEARAVLESRTVIGTGIDLGRVDQAIDPQNRMPAFSSQIQSAASILCDPSSTPDFRRRSQTQLTPP